MGILNAAPCSPSSNDMTMVVRGESVNLTPGVTSTNGTLPSGEYLRLSTNVDCYYKLQKAAAPVATNADVFLPAGAIEYVDIDDNIYFATILA